MTDERTAPERPGTATPARGALGAEELRGFLEATLRDAPVVVYAKDTALRFVMSNHRHAQLMGRGPDEVVGSTDSELFGDEGAEVEATSARVLSCGRPAVSEFPLTLPEGERVFHETIFRLTAPDGAPLGVGGIATDITERRQLEDQLARRNAELRDALAALRRTQAALVEREKLASLGGLVAGLSHEINTPLGVAVLATSMVDETLHELERQLQAAGTLSPSVQAELDRIRVSAGFATANVERAVALTRSFRDMAANREVAELRRTTLATWLEEAVATIRPLCQRHNVRLRHQCTSQRVVALPSGALHQILSNLVANACHHAFGETAGPRIVGVLVGEDDGVVTVQVDDNGAGVPEAIRSSIFEPFYTTRRCQGGTGLGLSVSYQLATGTLGGSLTVGTSPAGGARFTVRWTLPAV